MSSRRTYTDEFKTMIAELVLSGRSVLEVSREYSLSESAVRSWTKNKAPFKIDDETMSLEDLKRTQKEIARLKEENEILKKAMAIFARK